MYKAVRAFYRFSKYPETMPYRWRALRIQAAYDWARIAAWTITSPIWVPFAIVIFVTIPIAWLHDWADRTAPLAWIGDLVQPVRERWEKACEELNPIYLKSVRNDQSRD